ncbi:MAG: hypothetical protein LBQ28_08515 [Prevotellaceae bacterium]|nr:hypothetical protein [Prevotellaceae bacterium]
MKTLTTLQKNTQRIITLAILFFVFGFASNNANAQTRSYTLGVLQKTDYVIDEAYDIVDYFYFNDGEFIAKSMHFQDYAYYLYDSRQYKKAVQYSLMARGYAINAIEICDDYWQYYDYNYYGYSPVWGRNSGFTVQIGNVQLHWGLTNARYHNNMRINWNLYFTSREWKYYRNLPAEIVLLNNLYAHRGGVVYFNDRHYNNNVYTNMRVRINTGRDSFLKSHNNTTTKMSPKDIKPSNATRPTQTRRETMNSVNNSQSNSNSRNQVSGSNRPNSASNSNNTSSETRRSTTVNNSNNNNSTPSSSANTNQSSQNRRSSTSSSQTTTSSGKVDNKSNSTQETQTRRQSTQSAEPKQQTSGSSSSSSRRR